MVLIWRGLYELFEIPKQVLTLLSLPAVETLIVGDAEDTICEQAL
jgi:hypothetical protein